MSETSEVKWNDENYKPFLQMTEKAARIFKEACDAEGNTLEESYLRIDANPGGCSGYRYELDWNSAEQIQDSDVVFQSNEVNLVVDETSLKDVLGSVEIDYTDGNMVEQGFVFKLLRNGQQCGCGESFTPVKELR